MALPGFDWPKSPPDESLERGLMTGCLGDGPPRCVFEFPRCGPNGIRVATVTVNFPHPVGLPDVGLESAPVRG